MTHVGYPVVAPMPAGPSVVAFPAPTALAGMREMTVAVTSVALV